MTKIKAAVAKEAPEAYDIETSPVSGNNSIYDISGNSYNTYTWDAPDPPSEPSPNSSFLLSEDELREALSRGPRVRREDDESNEEMLTSRHKKDVDEIHEVSGSEYEDSYQDSIEPLKAYLDTKEKKYLYRFLFKSGAIGIYSNGLNFVPSRSSTDETNLVLADGRIKREIMSITMSLKCILMDFDISDRDGTLKAMETDLADIVSKLYIAHPNDIFRGVLDNRDIYIELLDTFRSKNIDIDPDYLSFKNRDFSSMRRASRGIMVIYVPCLEELIVVSKSYDTSEGHNYSDYYRKMSSLVAVDKKDTVEKPVNGDRIVINGTEYSQEAFESMVESSSIVFLNNLEIESYIHDREINSRDAGDSDNSGRESTELL